MMKSFGIVGEVDKTGSLQLPDLLLKLYGLNAGDSLEIYTEGNDVVMKKYPPACVFCGSEKDLKEYRNKSFCGCCADELKNYKEL